jgi:hypothetical protein
LAVLPSESLRAITFGEDYEQRGRRLATSILH